MLPYIEMNDFQYDDAQLEEWYQKFKSYTDNIVFRDNRGRSHKITTMYGHNDQLKGNKELIELKDRTLNKLAEEFLDRFNLCLEYNSIFLVTKPNGVLDWHCDGAGTQGAPAAAFMYNFRETEERAPTLFNYEKRIHTLKGYKAALINTETRHMVDNRNHGARYNFRISFYGDSFENIRDRILKSY